MRAIPSLALTFLLAASAARAGGLPPDREPTCPGIPLWSGIVAVELDEAGTEFREHERTDERDAGWRVLVLSERNRVLGPIELQDLQEELNRDVLVNGRCFVPRDERERRRVRELLPPGRSRALRILDPDGAVVGDAFSDPRRAVRAAGRLARGRAEAERGAAESEPGRVRTARLDGRAVSYLDAGAGEPAIVLVHGWACDRRTWRGQVGPLSRSHRVLAVDLPGHGASDEPARPYTMDLFADALAAVLDDARLDRAVLVGHSNGTPAVRQLWRRHPERVAALVFLDGPLRQVMTAEAAAPYLDAFGSEDWRDRLAGVVDSAPPFGLSEDAVASIRRVALEQPQEAIVGGLRAAVDDAIWTEEPIRVPALVVNAAQPAWTAEYEAFVHELIPGVDYRTWEGVSHFLQLERPAELNALIEDFAEDRLRP